MKLSAWARQQGIDYKTAYRWFRAGILPIPSRQLPTGTILVDPLTPPPPSNKAVLYAQVSSFEQNVGLNKQLARLVTFAKQEGFQVVDVVVEVGDGPDRPKLLKVLADSTIEAIIIECHDRLHNIWSEYIEAALTASGRKIIFINKAKESTE